MVVLAMNCGAQTRAAQPTITITPAVVVAGSPEVIRVHTGGANRVEGEWLGQKIEFFRVAPGEWAALAGVDVQAPPGESELKITLLSAGGRGTMTQAIEIHAAHYRTSALTVAPKFVEPGPEAMKEIEADRALKAKVFAYSAPEPLWHEDFVAPARAPATDSFGTRRMFNGEMASIHRGADFRAHMGTPVRAANSGVVVLARKLFYEGNCVVIDHGLGLFTESLHFSRIVVHEGQHVEKGELLGYSGATGRVTGPHLHWAVRWQDAFLDPMKLLKMNLRTLP